MEDEIEIVSRAEAFALRRGCRLAERLGAGMLGIVFAAVGNVHLGVIALKVHYDRGPYLREKSVCLRLRDAQIYEVRATLAFRAQFGGNWEVAQAVLYGLQRYGIYRFDPSPANIRFA